MGIKGSLISNEEIKKLLDIIQSGDEEAERLTRKLLASYNLLFTVAREAQTEKKRLEIYENDYHKIKGKYEELKDKYDKLNKNNKKTIEENKRLTIDNLLLKSK